MKNLLASSLLVFAAPVLHAQAYDDSSLPMNDHDASSISYELERSMADFQAAMADKAAAKELLAYLRSDPDNDRRDIIVKVGDQTAEYYVEQRVETIGIKETLKPSQWATDVGAVIKGATSGVSGTASVKVDVSRKNPTTGEETHVKVEVTISAKK